MSYHSTLSKSLREDILAVIAGIPTRSQLNRLVAVSHALAGSFLASKATHLSLRSMYGLPSSDLAYDCIADLFMQEPGGQFTQLRAYFAGLEMTTARDEEILAHLRRLVFSKVNQGVFRLYSEVDPSLAKILRNIKLAIHSLKNFEEVERFGEPCIAPGLCDRLTQKPPFEQEELEQCLHRKTNGNELIPELLSKLSLFVRGQDERCRIIPLVGVGLLFRSVYQKKEIPRPDAEGMDDTLLMNDATAVIRRAGDEVRRQSRQKYTQGGKVREEIFDLYFDVIHEELCDRFFEDNGTDRSLYGGLQQRIPGLTKDEYSRVHRNKVEYLLKQVHKKALKELKRMSES